MAWLLNAIWWSSSITKVCRALCVSLWCVPFCLPAWSQVSLPANPPACTSAHVVHSFAKVVMPPLRYSFFRKAGQEVESQERNAHMVFCYQNCSDLLWKKKCSSDWEKLLKFEAEGWEFNPKGCGGPKVPTGQEIVCHFSQGHAMVTKIIDFIHHIHGHCNVYG